MRDVIYAKCIISAKKNNKLKIEKIYNQINVMKIYKITKIVLSSVIKR